MNLLLALNTSQYGFFDSLLATGGLTAIVIIVVALLIYLLPAIIISSAIKAASFSSILPQRLAVVKENDDSFLLQHGVVLYKKYYDKELDRYVTPHGVFEPIYSSSLVNNTYISAFMYKK